MNDTQFANSYFHKCHSLMNENSKLKRKIMVLEIENNDLKKEIKALNDFIELEPLGDAND